jgi:NAD(P)-dependent dehydrogenase (short-subunit alcohol dehydrogenase family)
MTAKSILEEYFGVADKAVVVTGGSRGIGRAIAEAFVRGGARVYISARKAEACDQAAEELRAFGVCESIPADLSTIEGCRVLADAVAARESTLDVLVNNAGALWAAPIADYPESGWDKAFDVNVKGPFFLVQALLPMLQAAAAPDNPARVINVGSIDAFHVPSHETFAYSSSKAAVHHLSRHLAARLAPLSITVNVIAPGLFESRMTQGTIEQRGAEWVLAPVPMKRFASPTDLAGAAIYLSSKAGSYVTGAVLPVDGGMATTL